MAPKVLPEPIEENLTGLVQPGAFIISVGPGVIFLQTVNGFFQPTMISISKKMARYLLENIKRFDDQRVGNDVWSTQGRRKGRSGGLGFSRVDQKRDCFILLTRQL